MILATELLGDDGVPGQLVVERSFRRLQVFSALRDVAATGPLREYPFLDLEVVGAGLFHVRHRAVESEFQVAEADKVRGLRLGGEQGADAENCQQGKRYGGGTSISPPVFVMAAVQIAARRSANG